MEKSFNANFIKSAADEGGFLTTDKPMICVCGKSNVGKSSFINMLAQRKKLAKTSNTPGRTRLVNYFDFGDFVLADLPGYGYAEVSKQEKARWAKTLEVFFEKTPIRLVISLVDIRHDPTEDDKTMIGYLYAKRLPFVLVATKSDKIAKTKVTAQAEKVETALKMNVGDITATSSVSGFGRQTVIDKIYAFISSYDGENNG